MKLPTAEELRKMSQERPKQILLEKLEEATSKGLYHLDIKESYLTQESLVELKEGGCIVEYQGLTGLYHIDWSNNGNY